MGAFAALDAASNGPPTIPLKHVKDKRHFVVLGIVLSVKNFHLC